MPLYYEDLVLEESTNPGSGDFTLAGTRNGFRTFANALTAASDTKVFYYSKLDGANEWEFGIGTLSGSTTLERTEVILSSNSNSTVTYSSGTVVVQVVHPSYVGKATQHWIEPVREVSADSTNYTLSSELENGDTFNNVTLATGDRILLRAQTTASENGVYIVNSSGAPTRAYDMFTGFDAANSIVYNQQSQTTFACTNSVGSGIVGTDDLTFTEDLSIVIEQTSEYSAIRNGLFEIVQRGGTFTTIANNSYTFDGWVGSYDATSIVDYVDLSLDTNAPDIATAGYHIPHALKMDVTTAQASPSATAYWFLYQIIEGYIWERLRGAPCTLQFWARTDRSGGGILSTGVQLYDSSHRFFNKGHSLTSEWQQFQMTFTSEEGWTENLTNSNALRIMFNIACGTTYQAATDENWTTTTELGANGSTNFLDSASNNVWIADVRLVAGDAINTGPYPRSHEAEMQLCQRYYQTSYDHGTIVGTNTTSGLVQKTASGHANDGNQMPGAQWGVKMRTTPTVTIYTKNGTSGGVSDTNYNDFTTGCSIDSASEHGFRAIVKATVFTSARQHCFHYAATAEL